MWDWFRAGGVIMWPVLAAGLLAVGLAVDAGRKLLGGHGDGGGSPGRALRGRIGAVLFWGGFAALLGVLGTLVGVGLTARVLASSGGASADIVWGGIRVAIIPSTFGLSILAGSLLLWFGLSTAYRTKAGA